MGTGEKNKGREAIQTRREEEREERQQNVPMECLEVLNVNEV